jgi:hypothetical protein
MVIYSVTANKDLTNIIIKYFNKYNLLTQKLADFILFQKVIELMNNKEHLNFEGLKKIINIKSSMNKGLSDELKTEFSNFTPVERQLIFTKNIPDSK